MNVVYESMSTVGGFFLLTVGVVVSLWDCEVWTLLDVLRRWHGAMLLGISHREIGGTLSQFGKSCKNSDHSPHVHVAGTSFLWMILSMATASSCCNKTQDMQWALGQVCCVQVLRGKLLPVVRVQNKLRQAAIFKLCALRTCQPPHPHFNVDAPMWSMTVFNKKWSVSSWTWQVTLTTLKWGWPGG